MALAAAEAYPIGPGTASARARRGHPTVVVGVAAVAALAVALRLPAATTVIGLVVFGIVHNVLELRYVSGRFAGVLSGRLLAMLVVGVTGIVVCRLWPGGGAAPRRVEVLLAYGLLAAAWVWARRGVPVRAWWFGWPALGTAVAVSSTFLDFHFVVLTHLHNVVPLFFLWEWSRAWPRGRAAFRAVNVGWVLVVPALVLVGVFDGVLRDVPARLGVFGTFAPGSLSATYTPPAWLDDQLALRFLAVFAFMQTMHYVVWVWLLPRHAGDATAAFDARLPLLRGVRAVAVGLVGAVLLAVLLASDYRTGRTVYGALASYHAYLEFPVLLALLVGLAGRPTDQPEESTDADRPTDLR